MDAPAVSAASPRQSFPSARILPLSFDAAKLKGLSERLLVSHLAGGIEDWKKAGRPVRSK